MGNWKRPRPDRLAWTIRESQVATPTRKDGCLKVPIRAHWAGEKVADWSMGWYCRNSIDHFEH